MRPAYTQPAPNVTDPDADADLDPDADPDLDLDPDLDSTTNGSSRVGKARRHAPRACGLVPATPHW
jgi:hypothetical protein